MKFLKLFTGLLIFTLLLGEAAVIKADDPPKQSGAPTSEPENQRQPEEGSFEPFVGEATEMVLDATNATVTHLELEKDGQSLRPAESPTPLPPPVKGSFEPGPMLLGSVGADNETQIELDSADEANDLLYKSWSKQTLSGQELGASSTTLILNENFEGNFPSTVWDLDGNPSWNDVNCFPVESGGAWSGWPAGTAINPCSGASYPANLNSWMVYGPFSLADAKSASLDFYFRMVSESVDDTFFWGASINGIDFFGPTRLSGTFNSGPFNNGHNFVSFDLTDVFTLGNLAGRSRVWIAFNFVSDDAIQAQGPFIDAITLRKSQVPREIITQENFDLVDFPNDSWLGFDNNGATGGQVFWDDVLQTNVINCPARPNPDVVEQWSMWPADNGANARNVCAGQAYAPNMDSWLIYGPFNLQNTNEAWVDFHFRNVSETGFDFFSWRASVDGSFFSGAAISGTQAGGPYGNGYNLMRFDLSNVPGLGDLRGRPVVWLAFVFLSDGSSENQGAFVDDVTVVVERNKLFIPQVLNPQIPPTGALTFVNETNNPITVQIIGYGVRTFPKTTGPHLWTDIPVGTYDWLASGTCPKGQGQVGSAPPPDNRAPITIRINQTTTLNQEKGGKFACTGN